MAKKSSAPNTDKRPTVWALLSLAAFIDVFLSTTVMGYGLIIPFFLASVFMIAILFLETLTRGRSWLFEDHYKEAFAHKKTASRMIMFACGILLILETALLLGFVTDPRFDRVMINLIRAKHCALTNEGC